MASMTATGLWQRSLGDTLERDEDDGFRRRLVASLESTIERAALLAGEIARDLPDFSVHDASHSDALWTLADRIAGANVTLTPTEAYVFGAACALHDLGMASAAYVDGIASLEEEPRWSDAIALTLRVLHGSAPSAEQIARPDPEVARLARAHVLRDLHAVHAERLGTLRWQDEQGTQWSLIEDTVLRGAYGPIIGQIAHSHWWGVGVVEQRFAHALGAPAGAPAAWTVRPMLLACLLRLADASHLDASRAPRFLKAIRRPAAASLPHWDFQAHLAQPYPDGDRLVFTSSPFTIEETAAWWLCAETLQAVDRELRAVDALLADRDMERFAVRGVAGADDLTRLAGYVPPEGWTPIDARVRVSNVVHLVESLGGRELYGPTPHVPLRELIQNASDAVVARRAVERRPDDWGEIVVRLEAAGDDGGWWLEVEDTGVGMSEAVLTQHLLDFGTSFWSSEKVLEELPGLLGAAFEPTGQFGIGFFSVFMWGDAVRVTSRKHDAGAAGTYVLEFAGGVARRPLLRPAKQDERLLDGGTRVAVHLEDVTLWRLGIDPAEPAMDALAKLCGWLAPALDVKLTVELDGERRTVVEARDWHTLSGERLIKRIGIAPIRSGKPPTAEERAALEVEQAQAAAQHTDGDRAEADEVSAYPLPRAPLLENLRPLALEDGTVVGRLLLAPGSYWNGVVTVGGLRSTEMIRVGGILAGHPTTASRHTAIPDVPVGLLARWATEQARLLDGRLPELELLEAAQTVHQCGGDPGPLPIAMTCTGPVTRSQLLAWAAERERIVVLHDAALHNAEYDRGDITLLDSVIATPMGSVGFLHSQEPTDERSWNWPLENKDPASSNGILSLVMDAIASAWATPAATLWERQFNANPFVKLQIGRCDGEEVVLNAAELVREGAGSPAG